MHTTDCGNRRPSQPDSVFEQKHRGAIWEGTVENGIARFQNGDWSLFGRAEGLPPGQVRGFFENGDMPGVAVSEYGIFAWTGHRFRKLSSLPRGYISTPVKMGDGTVWFTVLHRGLFVMSGGRVRKMGTAEGLDGDDVSNLVLDPEGSLWVGTNKALYRWNNKRFLEIARTELLAALCADCEESSRCLSSGTAISSTRPSLTCSDTSTFSFVSAGGGQGGRLKTRQRVRDVGVRSA
jgi:hypothetical protein